MKQEGYIVLPCLLTITVLSLLILAMTEQNHWQQRLLSMLITNTQQDIAINMALLQLPLSSANDCKLDWQKSNEAFDRLNDCQPCCSLQQNKVQIRYLVINNQVDEPISFAIIARMNDQVWRQFQSESALL